MLGGTVFDGTVFDGTVLDGTVLDSTVLGGAVFCGAVSWDAAFCDTGPVWWPGRERLARLPARQERVDYVNGYPLRSRRTKHTQPG